MIGTRHIWPLLRTATALALLGYVVSGAEWRILGSLVSTWWLIAILVTLSLVGTAVEAIRLSVLYGALGLRVSFGLGFQLVTIATFFNFCIPGATGGDIVKMWYLNAIAKRHPAEMAAVWFVDRLTGLFSLLLLVVIVGLFSMPFVDAHPVLRALLITAVAALAGIAAVSALACTGLAGGLRRLLDLYLPRLTVLTRVAESLAAFRSRPGAIAKAIAVSFAGHIALLTTFVALGHFFMPAVAPGRVSLLSLFGLFANAVPLTPGGLGVGEAAFDTLFRLAGVTTGAALLLAWRIGMLPLCLAGGLLYMVGVRHGAQPDDPNPLTDAVAVR